MPTTPRGYVYPDSAAHTRLWEHLQALADSVEDDVAALMAGWTAYTPVLTGTGWAIGNGSTQGRYTQLGKLVTFRAELTIGSTTTKGSGSTQAILSLPVAAHADIDQICHGSYVDASPVARGSVTGLIAQGNSTINMYGVSIAAPLVAASPITWATGDRFSVAGTYEAA